MKTTGIIKRALSTIIFTFFCVLAVNAGNGESFCYNSTETDGVITSQIVYKLGSDQHSLTPYLKYDFAYNDKKQLTRKRAMKWNGKHNMWRNYYFINYDYTASGIEIEYFRWNSNRNMYEPTEEQSVYLANGDNKPESRLVKIANK